MMNINELRFVMALMIESSLGFSIISRVINLMVTALLGNNRCLAYFKPGILMRQLLYFIYHLRTVVHSLILLSYLNRTNLTLIYRF